MQGILQKTSIKKGHSSAVQVGHSAQGTLQMVKYKGNEPVLSEVKDFKDIEEGDVLMVYNNGFDFVKCSPITEIEIVNETLLEVKTNTSSYSFNTKGGKDD